MIKMNLHIKIAEQRITKSELSRLTGIRTSTISAYCNDTYKQISKEHLDMFCEILKCNVCDLIEYEESVENKG